MSRRLADDERCERCEERRATSPAVVVVVAGNARRPMRCCDDCARYLARKLATTPDVAPPPAG
jgi:hypothetical protein